MAYVRTSWAEHVALLGNKPGVNAGDVTIHLSGAVEGRKKLVVPSESVTLAAESGNLIGLQLILDDGRRAFIPVTSVLMIIDSDSAEDDGRTQE